MTELAALNVRITGDSGDLTAAVNSAKTQLGGLNTTITQTKANAAGMGGALGGMANSMRGVSQQLSQVGQQTMATGNFLQAMAIQLPDIGAGFGVVGAAAGLLAGIALPLLASAFSDGTEKAKALDEALQGVRDAATSAAAELAILRSGGNIQTEQEVALLREIGYLIAEQTRLKDEAAAADGQAAADLMNQANAMNAQINASRAELANLQAIRAETEKTRAIMEAREFLAKKANEAAYTLRGIMNQLNATNISSPWQTLVGAIQAAIDKAGEYARSSMQYSGRGGDPRQFGALAGQTGTFNVGNFAVPGGGGGGGAAVNPLQAELETLQQGLMTQEQLQIESYTRQQETLNNALQQRLISQQQHAALMEQVEKTHQLAMTKETNAGVQATLGHLGQLFQGSKKIGAAIALANSWLAFTEVLKDPAYVGRPFARFAAAAAALSSGLNAVRNIKSASPSGSTGGGMAGAAGGGAVSSAPQTSTQVALQLVGGDMFSRDQVMRLINAINDATSDGARIILR
jgi:hypothetical protein